MRTPARSAVWEPGRGNRRIFRCEHHAQLYVWEHPQIKEQYKPISIFDLTTHQIIHQRYITTLSKHIRICHNYISHNPQS
jgi:hypothetical protein